MVVFIFRAFILELTFAGVAVWKRWLGRLVCSSSAMVEGCYLGI